MVAEGADILDVGAESTRPYGDAVGGPARGGAAPAAAGPARGGGARRSGVDRHHQGEGREPRHSRPAPPSSTTSGVCSAIPTWRRVVADARRAGRDHAQPRRAPIRRSTSWPTSTAFFARSLAIAERAGIARERIVLDPGIGFGKTPEQSLIAIARLSELQVASACRCWSAPRASASSTRSRPPRPTGGWADRSPRTSLRSAAAPRSCARTTSPRPCRRCASPRRSGAPDERHGVRHRARAACLSRRHAARGQGRPDLPARSRARHRPRAGLALRQARATPWATTRSSRWRAARSAAGAIGWWRLRPARSPMPCSSASPRSSAVRVTVHKPHAPIAATFADVGVTIARSRRAHHG